MANWIDSNRGSAMAPSGAVKVSIVKCNDYQCQTCKQAVDALQRALRSTRPRSRAFEFDPDFPLEGTMRSGGSHGLACEWRRVVRIAAARARRGKRAGVLCAPRSA